MSYCCGAATSDAARVHFNIKAARKPSNVRTCDLREGQSHYCGMTLQFNVIPHRENTSHPAGLFKFVVTPFVTPFPAPWWRWTAVRRISCAYAGTAQGAMLSGAIT